MLQLVLIVAGLLVLLLVIPFILLQGPIERGDR